MNAKKKADFLKLQEVVQHSDCADLRQMSCEVSSRKCGKNLPKSRNREITCEQNQSCFSVAYSLFSWNCGRLGVNNQIMHASWKSMDIFGILNHKG